MYEMKGIGYRTLQAVIQHIDTRKQIGVTYKQNMGVVGAASNWPNIAGEIYSYMPTHYFKFLHILEEEEMWQTLSNIDKITIIDIGCGMGTVTHCFNDYIKEKLAGKKIDVLCLGLEPCSMRGELLDIAFDSYEDKSIRHNYIQGYFPQDIEAAVSLVEGENVIVLTSNLVNWIRDDYGNIRREEIKQGFTTLLDKLAHKNIWMLNTEMKKRGDSSLVNTLRAIHNEILKNDIYYTVYKCVQPKAISFLNPTECFFAGRSYTLPTEYHYVYTNIPNCNETFYTCINKIEQFQDTTPIYDSLEVLYTKLNAEHIKDVAIDYIKSGTIGNNVTQYMLTKPNGDQRCLIEEDIFDHIYETFILVNKGIIVDRNQEDTISYGNRLDSRESKNICIPYGKMYYKRYNAYVHDILKDKTYHTYFKIDISKYYNSINHRKLLEIVDKKYSYLSGFIRKYLNRSYIGCVKGEKGIPQGPEFSALLANIYLGEFDDWFIKKHPQHKLVRYVDDIVIFVKKDSKAINVRASVIDYLKQQLLLDINKGKSSPIERNTRDYYKDSDNQYYEQIQKKINYILNTIYFGVGKVLKKNEWPINDTNILKVQEKINLLDIWISKNEFAYGISRQVKMLTTPKGKIERTIKMVRWITKKQICNITIKWGDFNKLNEEWLEEFKTNNTQFYNSIKELSSYIRLEIDKVLAILKQDDNEKYLKRLKYLYNRAETFNIALDYNTMSDILTYNPLVDTKKLKRYPHIVKDLGKEIDVQELKLLELHKIWLLGEVRDEDKLDNLINLFKVTYEQGLGYQNTIITEALLKYDNLPEELFGYCIDTVKNGDKKEYILIRNILFIANSVIGKTDKILEEVEQIYSDVSRVKVLVEWIKNNLYLNILSLKEDKIDYEIGEEYGDGYELLMYIDEYIS